VAKKIGEKVVLGLRLEYAGVVYLELQKVGKETDEQELNTRKYGIK
jgi:hypothetical protein